MDLGEMLLIIAATINPYDVFKLFMSWTDAYWGAAVAVVLLVILLIVGWQKSSD